ncbi:hypothetical protein OIU76_006795 [Salix suchowensis]|nr:hypothetical protein OIU76_006795 [Salix suchowensis]
MGCGGGRNVATLDKVTELMRASDITEDDEFWSELDRDLDAEEITILSKMREKWLFDGCDRTSLAALLAAMKLIAMRNAAEPS